MHSNMIISLAAALICLQTSLVSPAPAPAATSQAVVVYNTTSKQTTYYSSNSGGYGLGVFPGQPGYKGDYCGKFTVSFGYSLVTCQQAFTCQVPAVPSSTAACVVTDPKNNGTFVSNCVCMRTVN